MTKPLLFHLRIAFFLAIFIGCDKGIIEYSSSQIKEEEVLFAQKLFEEEVLRLSDVLTKTVDGDNRPLHFFQLGNISPDWAASELIVNDKSVTVNKYVEVPVLTTFRYRVLQKSSEERKARRVKVYQELLVAPNSNESQHAVFMVFYIATNKYIKWNKGILNHRFDNSGNMRKYSGLKIYTDLSGRIIRINEYVNGKKINGVFFPRFAFQQNKEFLNNYKKNIFKNMQFQYGIRIVPPTKGSEDDDCWSYFDWDYNFDDDSYYAPEDELTGGCVWGDGHDNNDDYNDYDDYDDSWDPDDDNGFYDWVDDYDDLYGNRQGDGRNDGNQEDENWHFGNKQEKNTLDITSAKDGFKGKGYSRAANRDCFTVAKNVMNLFGITWLHGGAETKHQIQLGHDKTEGRVSDTSSIPIALSYITSRIDDGSPVLVGVDYKQNDNDVDHWIVVIGYWETSTSSIELRYVETGTGNPDYAFSETNTLSYTIGDDFISGLHWLSPDVTIYVTLVRKNP